MRVKEVQKRTGSEEKRKCVAPLPSYARFVSAKLQYCEERKEVKGKNRKDRRLARSSPPAQVFCSRKLSGKKNGRVRTCAVSSSLRQKLHVMEGEKEKRNRKGNEVLSFLLFSYIRAG